MQKKIGSEEAEQFWGKGPFWKMGLFLFMFVGIMEWYPMSSSCRKYGSGEKIGWDHVIRIVGTLKID